MTHLRLHYIQTLKEVSNGVKTYTTLFLTGILAQTFQTAPTRVQVFFNVYIMWCVCVCAHVFAVRHHESNYPPENYLSFEIMVNLPLLTYPCQKHEGFNKAL